MHTNFVEPQTVPIFFDKIRYYKELCLPCAASCKAKCDAVEKKAVENVKKKLEKKLKKENEKRAKRGEAPLESLGPTKPRKREYHSDHAPDRTATACFQLWRAAGRTVGRARMLAIARAVFECLSASVASSQALRAARIPPPHSHVTSIATDTAGLAGAVLSLCDRATDADARRLEVHRRQVRLGLEAEAEGGEGRGGGAGEGGGERWQRGSRRLRRRRR